MFFPSVPCGCSGFSRSEKVPVCRASPTTVKNRKTKYCRTTASRRPSRNAHRLFQIERVDAREEEGDRVGDQRRQPGEHEEVEDRQMHADVEDADHRVLHELMDDLVARHALVGLRRPDLCQHGLKRSPACCERSTYGCALAGQRLADVARTRAAVLAPVRVPVRTVRARVHPCLPHFTSLLTEGHVALLALRARWCRRRAARGSASAGGAGRRRRARGSHG